MFNVVTPAMPHFSETLDTGNYCTSEPDPKHYWSGTRAPAANTKTIDHEVTKYGRCKAPANRKIVFFFFSFLILKINNCTLRVFENMATDLHCMFCK